MPPETARSQRASLARFLARFLSPSHRRQTVAYFARIGRYRPLGVSTQAAPLRVSGLSWLYPKRKPAVASPAEPRVGQPARPGSDRPGRDRPRALQRPQPPRRVRHLQPSPGGIGPGHRPPDPPSVPGHHRHLRTDPRGVAGQRRHTPRPLRTMTRPRARRYGPPSIH